MSFGLEVFDDRGAKVFSMIDNIGLVESRRTVDLAIPRGTSRHFIGAKGGRIVIVGAKRISPYAYESPRVRTEGDYLVAEYGNKQYMAIRVDLVIVI